MRRTTLLIPDKLKQMAVKEAERLNISFSELIRKALEMLIQGHRGTYPQDTLLKDDEVYDKKADKSLSIEHDDIIYGEEN